MEQFAIGIAYGMGTASACWVVSHVVYSIYRVFRTV